MASFEIKGQVVNIEEKKIVFGKITIQDGRITAIQPIEEEPDLPYILPGFIDSHVHIESSMLIPSEFARLAVVHGTVATISDPHEIGNVCGVEGVEFMIRNGAAVPFKFHFGAPSCVPATSLETAGAAIDTAAVEALLQNPSIYYLSEMMNFPGVLQEHKEVMAKIKAAQRAGKPVDGHAPGLRGADAKKYIDAGISTDHECFTREEALDKLQYGMKILIREGSAARNFDALIDLLHDHPDAIMFCSDDKHPDSLVEGHINELCKRAIEKGIPLFNVLKAACINPVYHYKMNVGLLRINDDADFIVVEDLTDFIVRQTYIKGIKVADRQQSLIDSLPAGQVHAINRFVVPEVSLASLAVPYRQEKSISVIGALDGQLITEKLVYEPAIDNENIVTDTERDLLKLVVINRYQSAPVAKCFIHNFGFKRGAIASSVAHDSHNIVAVGADDESILKAVQAIIEMRGGISCTDGEHTAQLALPVAGLMSAENGYTVAHQYTHLDQMAKSLGTKLSAPFMTLSFMALLVIPHLKLSDLGLFDGDNFRLVENG